jgi:hypothetical protein
MRFCLSVSVSASTIDQSPKEHDCVSIVKLFHPDRFSTTSKNVFSALDRGRAVGGAL